MARGMRRSNVLDRGVLRSDRVMSAAMSSMILVTLVVWIALKEGLAKYVLYSIPFSLTLIYLVVTHGRVKLNRPGVIALGLYLMCAVTSMVANSWYGFHALRDVAIIAGYLYLYALWFRMPASVADFSMFALAVCMLVEAATEGFGEEINIFGSQGILESTLAFPIGAVTLYYLHMRQWGRALIALIWLFLAFKRITFLAVPLAVGFDIVISRYLSLDRARRLALGIVVALSIISLFSTQIFEYIAETLKISNTSANSISLGRYEMAKMLWGELRGNSLTQWLVGSGPGSADALLVERTSNVLTSNPHNDWLKILFDYGAFGFVVLHAVIFRVLCEHRLGVMLYLYGAVLMLTDNVFIYMFYHPFVLLMVSAARREPSREAVA
jgi:hypothetical protein